MKMEFERENCVVTIQICFYRGIYAGKWNTY